MFVIQKVINENRLRFLYASIYILNNYSNEDQEKVKIVTNDISKNGFIEDENFVNFPKIIPLLMRSILFF